MDSLSKCFLSAKTWFSKSELTGFTKAGKALTAPRVVKISICNDDLISSSGSSAPSPPV